MSGLSRRIHDEIGERIRSGAWPCGHRLPTEHELAVQYGCARMTVTQALSALARDGLVERRRRAGTFVAAPRVHTAALEIPDIAATIAGRGMTYAFVEVSRAVRPPLDAPDEAALEGGGEVLALEGVHMASDIPFALERRIVRLDAAPQARDADFSTEGPGGWLLAHTPWSEARHRISAVAAESACARRLGVARGSPCLQLERWTWRMGQGVTFACQRFPGARFDLVADFGPAAASPR